MSAATTYEIRSRRLWSKSNFPAKRFRPQRAPALIGAMDVRFTACPHLPTPTRGMDWSSFRAHGPDRSADFYRTALEYAQFLWLRGNAARAILCLDRALSADLRGDEPVLVEWPLPYRAMAWFLAHAPPGVFIGNPRVHFQHLADRMNEPRREQRAARAWACWVVARAVLPHLPGDPRHVVVEPTEEDVARALERHGIAGEVALWRSVVADALHDGPAGLRGEP